jgi:hypothetical protein
MKFISFHRVILSVVLLFCFSCSSELDFDQAQDFNVQPVFTTNLAYFNAQASDFTAAGAAGSSSAYVSNVDFLNTSFLEDNLIEAALYFRFKNTIARDYVNNIIFFDSNGAPIYTISVNVPASVNDNEVLVERTETFTTTNIAILKNTVKMVFAVTILPGPPLTATSPGRIEMSSSLTAYFDVQ